jgi:tetratricopeptide (TPR) repeat protein
MLTKEQRRSVLVCLVLALGTTLLYWPATLFDFIYFDDQLYVLTNPHLKGGLSWRGLIWCFQAGYGANWHPITWMSHMLDCQCFGLKPGGPHAINLLLHAANSVLLFLVLKRMTNALWRSAMVAALFAWHPLHVESVAWIAERKDVLSALFWILTLWAYCNYVRKRGVARYVLTLWLFILGLMAKPMVVTLPFVLLLLDWWPLGRFQSKPARPKTADDGIKSPRLILLEKLPFLFLAAGSCVLTLVAQQRGGAISSFARVPMTARLANSSLDYLRYAGKMFWPVDLSIIYPLVAGWQKWEIAAAAAFIIAVSAGTVFCVRTRPYWIVGWLWYLGTLLPVIGLVQVGSQSMADRYTYIPSIGFSIMVCWGVCDFTRHWRYHQICLGCAAITALAACAFVTEKQLGYWRDSGALFRHALAVNPNNYLAHTYYGAWLREQHQLEQARMECEKAVQIAPSYALGHCFLAGVLLLEGKTSEAASEVNIALMREPNLLSARANLGDIYLSENLYGAAAVEYGKALEYHPDDPKLYFALGMALALQKKFDEARANFETALRLNPFYTDAHYELALTLSEQKKTAEAIAEYRAALKIQRNFSDALNNLAWILAANPNPQLRNGPEAVELAERACALTHDSRPLMIGTLAAAYAEAGRFDDAVVTAQKAHDVAAAQGKSDVSARNLELLQLYRSRRAYHEGP